MARDSSVSFMMLTVDSLKWTWFTSKRLKQMLMKVAYSFLMRRSYKIFNHFLQMFFKCDAGLSTIIAALNLGGIFIHVIDRQIMKEI